MLFIQAPSNGACIWRCEEMKFMRMLGEMGITSTRVKFNVARIARVFRDKGSCEDFYEQIEQETGMEKSTARKNIKKARTESGIDDVGNVGFIELITLMENDYDNENK